MQSIKEKLQKSKPWVFLMAKLHHYSSKTYITTLILVIGVAAFFSGRLITIYEDRLPISMLTDPDFAQETSISQTNNQTNSQNSVVSAQTDNISTNPKASTATESYIASKTGKSYYFPWCATAKRIKEENKIWFASRAAAESAGYKPASNCPGLE